MEGKKKLWLWNSTDMNSKEALFPHERNPICLPEQTYYEHLLAIRNLTMNSQLGAVMQWERVNILWASSVSHVGDVSDKEKRKRNSGSRGTGGLLMNPTRLYEVPQKEVTRNMFCFWTGYGRDDWIKWDMNNIIIEGYLTVVGEVHFCENRL